MMRAGRKRNSLGASYCSALAIVLVALNGDIAAASPGWETTNAAGLEQGVAIAVCLPGDEVVCIGVGCRVPHGFDFVEMIVGDWLEGPTRLSAGAHTTTSVMRADNRASRALNVPVSRGPVDHAFLLRLVGRRTLRVEALWSGYSAVFPLVGFGRARRMLPHICAAARATS
jgi:hypothetical protein